ncbi:fibronectin type III domain-containing protein [Cellulomonas iranensis]|uniref:fibronectin type III domain-containing protein n=2 Tax=Cellulomonas iranensis TaxID=76862 RepID=UPI001CF1A733|nr:fibronectin type III domain-containing protein [Cellulomonas iranensis]UCN16629.1 fibronectin type III domain-containing protein [Cellulomonas iranensis]
MRRLLGRPGDRQRGFAEAGVAVTGAALVLGAALGSGVASTVVTMSDGVTWLPDDQTGQVVQINPGTGRAERRLQVAGPGAELDISQRDGVLVVGDGRTGSLTSIDLATLLASGQRTSGEPARVLVGGGLVYLVTPGSGVVRAVDPLTLKDLGTPHRVGGALADAVVDARGTVWVVTAGGDLQQVTWKPADERFDVGEPRPVRGAGSGTRLLPHERGVTLFAPDGGAVLQVGVGRDLAVAVPDLAGEVLPADSSPTDLAPAGVPGRSAVVMLAGDRILDVGVGALGCERPGRPAVFAGLVYVPCTGAGRVVVLRPDGTRARADVVVPGGRDPRLLVDDGRLVVHTEDGARAVVVEADGSTRAIDTGRSGAPVHDPRDTAAGPSAAVPPQRPQQPTQPQRPDQGAPPPGADPGVPPVGAPEPPPGAPDAPTPGGPPTLPVGTPTGAPTGEPTGRPPGTPTPTPTPTGTATPTPDAPPGRPSAVVATLGTPDAAGLTDVTVTWRAGTPPADDHVVRTSAAGVAPVEVGGGATTATVRGVVCGTRVTFSVEAVAGAERSAAATSAAVTTAACPPQAPAAPTGVTAVAGGDGSVTVSWTASRTPVDAYLVGPEGGSTTTTSGDATSLVLRDLPPGAGVRFVVQAQREGLTAASAPSNAVTVAGPPGGVGGLAAALAGRAGDVLTVDVTWSAPADNGSPLTGYDVAWSGGGTGGSTTTGGTGATLSVSCAGQPLCTAGGTLTVSVTPSNGVGAGPAASAAVAVAAPPPPPPANGDRVVGWVSAGTPGRGDRGVPMNAELTPPASWANHPGGCTLVVTYVTTSTQPVPCTGGSVHLGSFEGGGGQVTVAVRAENVAGGSVTSAAVTERVPNRNEWAYCDPTTGICTLPVSVPGDTDVVVVPLPWTPRLPVGPERPPLAAAGAGLLLAAGALRAARLRTRPAAAATDDAAPTAPPSPHAPTEESPA